MVHECGCQRLILAVVYHSFLCFLRHGLLLNLGLTGWPTCPAFPQGWGYRSTLLSHGFRFRPSCLHEKHFTHWAIFSVPKLKNGQWVSGFWLQMTTYHPGILSRRYYRPRYFGLPYVFWFQKCVYFFLFSLRQGFTVVLEPILELALVDQASLELTEIHLPLPPECWD